MLTFDRLQYVIEISSCFYGTSAQQCLM